MRFTSQNVVTAEAIGPGTILVEDGRIVSVQPGVHQTEPPADYDFGDLCILPGLVDTHVHINDPGRSDWEGFATATRAAAAGGYTTLIDMPLNSIPATTSVAGLEAKRAAAAGRCLGDYGFWGGVIPGNDHELDALIAAGVPGFKCFLSPSGVDEFPMTSEAGLRAALPHIARAGLPLLVHAESPQHLQDVQNADDDWNDYRVYLASRPDASETAAIRLLIALCREYACRIHVVHLSSVEPLPDLQRARAEGLPITVETCPHYLHFTSEAIEPGATVFKCAPPIRSARNREQLWNALAAGDIDLIATDHSPCPASMKSGDFASAWGGIASLSLALPVIWTEARQRGIALHRLADWMSRYPAQLAGLGRTKGRIAPGYDADFVIFDPTASFTVTEPRLHYRHPVSAYMGETLRGEVRHTFLRGQSIYSSGQFADSCSGRECRLR